MSSNYIVYPTAPLNGALPITLVDTRLSPGIITLPEINELTSVPITIKDAYGSSGSNIIIINTAPLNNFEGNYGNTLILSNAYSFVTLYPNIPNSTWYIFNETPILNNLFTTDLIPASQGLNIGTSNTYPIANIYLQDAINLSGIIINMGLLPNEVGSYLNIESSLNVNGNITGIVFTGDGSGLSNLSLGSYGISTLSSIVSYGLSSLVTGGTSSLSSIVSYGLSSLVTFGTSSLSSIVSYGLSSFVLIANLSTINTNFISSTNGFISSLIVNSLTVGTGSGYVNIPALQATVISTIYLNAGNATVTSLVGSNITSSNINQISSVISYGLSSLQTTFSGPGTSSLSSIVSYGLSSLANGVVTINGQLIINSNSSNPALTVNGVLDLIDTYYGSNNNINVTSNILYFNNNVLYGQLQYIPQFITF